MHTSRPYLIRAMYEWITDNGLTPYLMVDATVPRVIVPEKYIEDGKIVLNIQPDAVRNLQLGNHAIEFDARFSGVSYQIHAPVLAVRAIYAFENGRGMVFNEDDDDDDPPVLEPTDPAGSGATSSRSKPPLKIVK